MKNIFIFFVLFTGTLFCFGSCADGVAPIGDTLPKIDTIDCPLPEWVPDLGGGQPKNRPKYYHQQQRRSGDGSKVAYIISENSIGIVDVKTGEIQTFNPYAMMPNGFRFNGCFGLSWCPYDNNKLALNCVTGFDTIIAGQGKSSFYGQNFFILSIKENTLSRIDLPSVGFAGANEFELYDWKKGSTPSADSILLGYAYGQDWFLGIFIPQENKLVRVPEIDDLINSGAFPTKFSFSPDRQHFIIFKDGGRIYIDGVELLLDDTYDLLYYVSWSPDGKKFILTGDFYEGGKVGVVDVDKWLREKPSVLPLEKIDLRKRFCMYNLGGGYPDAEFLTNTTLAISMHRDGDMISPLWEITTDGRLLRQLTK